MRRLHLPSIAAPLALAGALAVGLAAGAQTPPPAGPDATASRHDRGDAMKGRWREERDQRRAQVLADWTTVLKLSPAQSQALAATLKRPDRAMDRTRRDGDRATEGTMQRLDDMQARMAKHEARMAERLTAMKAFYTSLNPDQQRTFDAVTRLSHHGMNGRGMGRGHGRGFGPRGDAGGPPPPPPGA